MLNHCYSLCRYKNLTLNALQLFCCQYFFLALDLRLRLQHQKLLRGYRKLVNAFGASK
jgi:hypothetical protein